MDELVTTYIASSGNEYWLNDVILSDSDAILTKSVNYHDYGWEPETIDRRMGATVTNFGKKPAKYKAKLYLRGTPEERRAKTDALHNDFDRDIANKTPGQILWHVFPEDRTMPEVREFIDCYIISSSTYDEESMSRTVNDIVIYCPYPMWYKPISRNYSGTGRLTPSQFLDYDYDYAYDFTNTIYGADTLPNDSAFPAHFKLHFIGRNDDGPADITNPVVWIAGHTYGVLGTIRANEWVEIDSKAKTVTYVKNGTTKINWFDRRTKQESVFTQIPPGDVPIAWGGDIYVNIILYAERSEPKWASSIS